MIKDINQRLGEAIFNGTILFLSISFALFPFSIESGNVSPTESFKFGIIMLSTIALGIGSLICAFFGMNKNSYALITWALVCCLAMIVLLGYTYSQIYTKTIEYKYNLQIQNK